MHALSLMHFPPHHNPRRWLLLFYLLFIGENIEAWRAAVTCLGVMELVVHKKAWPAQRAHGTVHVEQARNKPLSSVAKKLDGFESR